MANYSFYLRNTAGNIIGIIPKEAWLYFEYTRRVNDVSSAQGIISTDGFPQMKSLFNVRAGGNLDAILEIWRRPDTQIGLPTNPWRLDAQFLLRYERREQLNDGRARITPIFKSPLNFLERERIQPRTAIPPANTQLTDFFPPSPTAWPWTLPTEDNFPGRIIAPFDTPAQMASMVNRCKVTNPNAFAAIGVPVPPAGGIADHRVSERYRILLEALQRASGASWYEWFFATGGVGTPTGCDFDLIPNPAAPYFPWAFTVFPNGRGADNRGVVVISPKLDNVIQPVSITDRLQERTRILVGGADKGRNRDILSLRNPTAEADSIWNWHTDYYDSRNISDFGLRVSGSQCANLGATQLRITTDGFAACASLTVRVSFKNGEEFTATVIGFNVGTGELDVDFFFVINCDSYGGPQNVTCLDPTSSLGINQSVQEGLNRLKELGEKREMSAILRQTGGLQYGVDVDLGDLVTVSFDGDTQDRQIREVRVLLQKERSDQVTLELGMLDGRYWKGDTVLSQIINFQNDLDESGQPVQTE